MHNKLLYILYKINYLMNTFELINIKLQTKKNE